MARLTPLPIDAALPDLIDALKQAPNVVLRAPTGSGKTTRVPGAVWDAGLAGDRRVVMLEPRRVAARAAARRMSAERGTRLGEEVGFHVRFDRQFSASTRILVVTEGLLVRMLQEDPFLDSVGAVILDEFHERSLHADLSLAMLRRVQAEARPDLRLVVMSATLDVERLAAFLGDCPVVSTEGRRFPVEVVRRKFPTTGQIHEEMADAIREQLPLTEGDLLAFLPGVGEIRRTAGLLRGIDAEVSALYGDLPAADQDRLLRPGDGRRVILATNLAETSLTIPGVRAVIDSGWARVVRQDSNTGLERLALEHISRASADQRAGRAGREAPGRCIRLWTDREEVALDAHLEPELLRVDLMGPFLELLAWGENPWTFPWFEAPSPTALTQARQGLEALGAVDAQGITALGRSMARFPLHPRLARLILEGHRLGVTTDVIGLAALLSERDPIRPERAVHRSRSDALDRLEAVEKLGREGARAFAKNRQALDDLARRELTATRGRTAVEAEREEAVLRSILAAWPDRVCRRRVEGEERGRMVGGRGVRLDPRSAVDAEWFVALEADAGEKGRGSEAVVRMASAIEPAWLSSEEVVESFFDPSTERVSAVRRRKYRDLILQETPLALPSPEQASAALADAARSHLERALGLDREPEADVIARWRWLQKTLPELELPDSEAALLEVLPELCAGRRSFAELRTAPVAEALRSQLNWKQQQDLDAHAPARIQVPSGSWIRVQYAEDPPVLAVRIQELFGWPEAPRLAGGRVRLCLHLLSPNHRPQQITSDLDSFWKNTWPEVRKELRSRYPRHSWPEDPWNAPAESRPRRRS